jgi:hypothetical protein
MTARAFLTDHTKKEKETARKRGPSLQKKTKQLGEIARIRTLTLYEDPTHGVWHVAMHCPTGKSFPDLNALVSIEDPCAAEHATHKASLGEGVFESRRTTESA